MGRVQSNCPVSTAPSCSTPSASQTSLYMPAQRLCGICTWSPLCCCASLCKQLLGTLQGLQTAQLSPPEQASVHTSTKHLLETPAAWKWLSHCKCKSFSQKTNPKGQAPNPSLRWWHRDVIWHQSLAAYVWHTSGWGHGGIPEMAKHVQDS